MSCHEWAIDANMYDGDDDPDDDPENPACPYCGCTDVNLTGDVDPEGLLEFHCMDCGEFFAVPSGDTDG